MRLSLLCNICGTRLPIRIVFFVIQGVDTLRSSYSDTPGLSFSYTSGCCVCRCCVTFVEPVFLSESCSSSSFDWALNDVLLLIQATTAAVPITTGRVQRNVRLLDNFVRRRTNAVAILF